MTPAEAYERYKALCKADDMIESDMFTYLEFLENVVTDIINRQKSTLIETVRHMKESAKK